MLASRARIVPRFPSVVSRRFMANQPSSSPSTARPVPATPVSTAPVATPTTQSRPTASPEVIPTSQQRAPRKMQDGYSGAFYLSLLGGLVVTAPIITYFYWEHRKIHMREKKEQILKEIHARVRTP